MKKVLAMLLTVVCVLLFTACSDNSFDYYKYVSELRLGIYEGESENFKVCLSAEQREFPFAADGYVGEIKNALVIKTEFKNSSPDDASVSIDYDTQNVKGSLSYNPVSGKSTATLTVEKLPVGSSVNVEITSGEITEKVTLSSVVFDKTVDYLTAIKSIADYDKETVNRLFLSGSENAEIHVRLIHGDGKNYYYIGFVDTSGKTDAYLVDGESGSVLAKKSIS